ncbi:transcription factor bHLH95-like [Primulina eburnea]|uniref:transcription factor bHLH95-like n=1 Tax=Primulina eburnea TaxID=1245227 RepID=UPI003C6C97F0
MLAMAEFLGHEDNFLWRNQSWPFPNLGDINGENNGKKLVDITNNTDGQKPTAKEEVAPPASKGKKRSAAACKGGASGGEPDNELHIWTERERRKKMRNMFGNLHALLPHLPPKPDKSTIVDEAVNYIKNMQQTLEKLEKQKLERLHGSKTTQKKPAVRSREAFLADQPSTKMINPRNLSMFSGPPVFKTWTSPNVTLNICGGDAQISVCGQRKPGLLTVICYVMEKYRLEVVSAQVSADGNRCMYTFHTRVSVNGIHGQFQDAFPVEEIYKQAAAEIIYSVA